MRSLFAAVTMLVASLSAMATDYPGTLAVIIDGNVADPTATQITLNKQEDSKYTLSLNNFILVQGEDMMPVGNIVLKDVVAAEENGVVTLETVQDILIEEGDLIGIPMWLGPMLGPVPVELKATLNGDVLSADIDIPLESLGQTIKVVFDSRNFQLPNSGFEEFHTAKAGSATSDEPNNWHSFMSCTGNFASFVGSVKHTFISDEVRPGSAGSKSVLVKSDYAIGTIVANGTLTTGQLNAGAMTATDTKNNAFLDFSNSATDANGDPFYTVLNTLPDSISVWVKFQQGETVPAHPYATMTAVITDGSYYQEPTDKDYSNIIVGQAANKTIESTGEWQKIVVPFEYLNPDKAPKGILVTFSTNADPGQGTANDELYIDDVELIYSSYLSSITIDGVAIPDFASDKYDYEYNWGSKQIPSAEELVKMISCEGSKEIKTFVTVSEDNVASILVLSADLMSNRTYTITFVNEGYDITVAPTENGSIHVVPASKENQKIDIVAEPAEGYELAEISVVGASGNPVEVETDGLGAMSFIMPAETVTITATFQEAYARLSDYTVSCEGKFDEDGTVRGIITYKLDLKGSYADIESYAHFLGVSFTYDVKDAQGSIVTSGKQTPQDINDGTVYIDPELQPTTEYTIVVTGAAIYDYMLEDFERPIFLEEGELATTTFTTGIPTNIADIDTASTVKADGKYIENGQIVIYRNGVKYNVAGVVIR